MNRKTLLSVLFIALCATIVAPSAEAVRNYKGGKNKADCENYAKDAIAQVNQHNRLHCPGEGDLWNPKQQDHFNWCMDGKSSNEMKRQWNERANALRTCEKSGNKGGAAGSKKGPTQQLCQNDMNTYTRDMKDWNAAQTQCQQLAQQNKPTRAVYDRYLKACNAQDAIGRQFYTNGCDKAFPNMPAPGQGPNTCAQQVKDNCPLK